jgi:hypothetical protein
MKVGRCGWVLWLTWLFSAEDTACVGCGFVYAAGMRGVKYPESVVSQAQALRRSGFTYQEIADQLGQRLPKATVATWCRGIELGAAAAKERRLRLQPKLAKAREAAQAIKRKRRLKRERQAKARLQPLVALLDDVRVAKIVLAMLYAAEGGKTHNRACVTFGNSDPRMIKLFLRLFGQCYELDPSRFRCTVMGRADMDYSRLNDYWQKVTRIPNSQFYAPRIDPRTVGKPSRKPDYKGVCRIDYFSAPVYNDIVLAIDVIMGP